MARSYCQSKNLTAIKTTVAERYDRALTEAQINRICDLAILSLCRTTHELILNTVLSRSEPAKDFLIAFLEKWFELKKGPNARLTRWEQYFKKAEIVNQTLRGRMVCTRASSAPSPSNQTQARFSGNPDPTGTCVLGAEAEPQPLIRVTDQQIVATLPQSKEHKRAPQRIRIP